MYKTYFTLEKIVTEDGLELEGIFKEPGKRSKYALIWVHGLTGRFYAGYERILELAKKCSKNKIAFASFNTRGHDIAASFYKKMSLRAKRSNPMGYSHILAGGGLEKFEDCIKDIKAVIKFLKTKGYKKIFLCGHSTGANKALYYLYKTQDKNVSGLGLIGPVSDIAGQKLELGRKFNVILKKVEKFAKKNKNEILPPKIYNKIMSAARYLSLYKPGSKEDVFPYHNLKAKFKELKSVKVPILVAIGEKDEYLDRSAEEFIKIFQKNAVSTKKFFGKIIKNTFHGFQKKEADLAEKIVGWAKDEM